MNRNKLTTLAIAMSCAALSSAVRADDSAMNDAKQAVEHPITTMHESEARSANTTLQISEQQKKEAKAQLDQAKTDYEKSLQANGAESDVTKEAKKRLTDAKKEYRRYARKTEKASKDLQEDLQKVNQDKASSN